MTDSRTLIRNATGLSPEIRELLWRVRGTALKEGRGDTMPEGERCRFCEGTGHHYDADASEALFRSEARKQAFGEVMEAVKKMSGKEWA